MKRVLLVQPSLHPPGGGNGLAAWMIEALRREHAVCALTWRPIDLEKTNRSFGTSLHAVRAHVPAAHLHIIGVAEEPRYYERLRALAQPHASWVLFEGNLARTEVVRVLGQHRYGLHGMREEPFGMAVAEMIQAGSIVFVPDGGGQVEIVGDDERLRYVRIEDAAAKIVSVMRAPAHQAVLREHLAARRRLFSTEQFTRAIREIVDGFDEAHAAGGD